jgi:hypothetical protein
MKILKFILIGITILFGLWFFWLKDYEQNQLFDQGNIIIGKIEAYKKEYKRLPDSLENIGIKVVDEVNPPIYYDKRDSIHYVVMFSIGFDDSHYYYSDSKKWEIGYRDMY